jgi:acyl carrier protein
MEYLRALKLVQEAIKEHENRDIDSYALDVTMKELGANSLDVVQITMLIEEHLDGQTIEDVDLNNVTTVQDLISLLERRY